jgi:hypothetical protein
MQSIKLESNPFTTLHVSRMTTRSPSYHLSMTFRVCPQQLHYQPQARRHGPFPAARERLDADPLTRRVVLVHLGGAGIADE